MSVALYAHPLSSYCQKVLVAFYENDTPFEFRMLDDKHPENGAELRLRWPIGKFPVLLDDGRTVMEASIIIEHLALHHPGPAPMFPSDPGVAIEVRMMDRFFDNYVSSPQQRIVFDALRPAETRDPAGVAEARAMLETAYAWADDTMASREWAAGRGFSLADCAAAPALFYAHWTHPIDARFEALHAYRERLMARPSFARAIDEARPYRSFFPLGVPERD